MAKLILLGGPPGVGKIIGYAESRLRLIEALPFTKIDTSDASPVEVAREIAARINQSGDR
ncbi:MAG: hypothetical protein ACREIA_14180 [Opitutaceae bacterium]